MMASNHYSSGLRKLLIIYLLLLPFFFSVKAQSLVNGIGRTTAQIIPPAPKTAALGTFGQIPVDLNTGSVSVAIPLTEVQSGSLRISVALRYASTGVKISEGSSWVGQNWNLMPGGVITRTVRGRPDEAPLGYKAVYARWRRTDSLASLGVPGWVHRRQAQARLAYGQDWDLEADTYTVSAPGLSATLTCDARGRCVLSPDQGWRVLAGGPDWSEWTLVDPNGTRYEFGEVENCVSEDAEGRQQDFSSAWHLTRIESADQHDYINFTYISDGPAMLVPVPQVYQIKFAPPGVRTPQNTDVLADDDGANCNAACFKDPPTTGIFGTNFQSVVPVRQATASLRSIRTATQCLWFDSAPMGAVALPGQYSPDLPSRLLRRLRIQAFPDTSASRSRTCLFTYSYSAGNNLPGDSVSGRHFLKTVREVGKPATRLHYYDRGDKTLLPSRSSFAQDHWGYYNGAVNATLVPQLTLGWRRKLELGARRATNPAYLQAGSLSSIEYPTGGSTYFTFEANQALAPFKFDIDEPALGESLVEFRAMASGSTSLDSLSQHVYDALYGSGNPYVGPGSPFVAATLVDLPEGARSIDYRVTNLIFPPNQGLVTAQPDLRFVRLNMASPDPVAAALNDQPIYPSASLDPLPQELPPGTYLLVAVAFDPQVRAGLSLSLIPSQYSGLTLVARTVGGLRIRRMVDYPALSPGDSVVTTYDYTMPDSRFSPPRSTTSGMLFNVPAYIKRTPCGTIIISARDTTLIPRPGNSGYHVGYQQVRVTRKSTAISGSTTTTFLNTPEPTSRALVQREEQRDAASRIVQDTQNRYAIAPGDSTNSIKFRILSFNETHYGFLGANGYTECRVFIHDTVFAYPSYKTYQWRLPLRNTQLRRLDPLTGQYFTTNILYRNQPDAYGRWRPQPSETASILAPGDTLLTWHRFAADYDTTSAFRTGDPAARGIAGLLARSATAAVVEERQGRGSGMGRRWLSSTLTEYAALHPHRRYALTAASPVPALALPPTKLQNGYLIKPSSYRSVLELDRYSTTGDLLQLHQPSGLPTSFIWGSYKPIAEAVNAPYAQLAATSFEPAATGRWRYDSLGTHRVAGGFTGRWAYRLDGLAPVSRDQLPAGDYDLTAWMQSSTAPTLTLTAGQVLSAWQAMATTPNGWTQFRTRLRFTANGRVSLNSPTAKLLDELRLSPVGSQLTTYTHDPLVGMTSQTDPTGRTTTYEYDALGRLVRARDEQGRILSQKQYHYAKP